LLERLPDRAKTPRVARAMTSPSGILLAGAGASAAIIGGLPLLAAAGVGLAAWAARVALAVPRRAKEDRIDPGALAEPWRSFVREAQDAARRYRRAVAATAPGPLRERLADIGTRIDTGVVES
jgi:type IV secretory pathway TrbD component